MNTGKIIQVMGPVVDLSFAGSELPELYNAILIKRPNRQGDESEHITCEVALHSLPPTAAFAADSTVASYARRWR